MKITKIVLVSLFLVLLTGCGGGEPVSSTSMLGGITRFYDNDAGVVCWVYNDFEKGGISCLPLKETKLNSPNVR
jgi:hypothetical protein